MNSCEVEHMFTKSELKTRQHWLVSTLTLFVLYPLAELIFTSFLSKFVYIQKDIIYRELNDVISGMISMWIIWYCAYKKHGTEWLTLSQIGNTLYLFRTIYQRFNETTHNVCIIVFIAIDVGLFLWWFLLTLKLMKINEFIQKQKILERFRD